MKARARKSYLARSSRLRSRCSSDISASVSAPRRRLPSVSLGALFMARAVCRPAVADAGPARYRTGRRATPARRVMTPLDFVELSVLAQPARARRCGARSSASSTRVARDRGSRAGVTLGLLVVSHWVLDVITHRPDMPLTLAGTTRLGLGLWNSMAGTLAIEFLLFFGGPCALRARDRRAGSRGIGSDSGRSTGFLVVGLRREHLRAAAPERARGGVVGASDVAAGRMGVSGSIDIVCSA